MTADDILEANKACPCGGVRSILGSAICCSRGGNGRGCSVIVSLVCNNCHERVDYNLSTGKPLDEGTNE